MVLDDCLTSAPTPLSPLLSCPRLPKFDFEETEGRSASTVVRDLLGESAALVPKSNTPQIVPRANSNCKADCLNINTNVSHTAALPITTTEISTPDHYSFTSLPKAMISSRSVQNPTLKSLHDMFSSASTLNASISSPNSTPTNTATPAANSVPQAVITTSPVSVSVLSSADNARISTPAVRTRKRLPECVAPQLGGCMGSLYFDDASEVWPSAAEVEHQLSLSAENGSLDNFQCTTCQLTLGAIITSRHAHWMEHTVFCPPCGQQLRVQHGEAFCTCANPPPQLYVKYYNFKLTKALVRCSSCFTTCFGCAFSSYGSRHRRQATSHELRLPMTIDSAISQHIDPLHRRNVSDESAVSVSTAPTTVITVSSTSSRAHSRSPSRTHRTKLLPAPVPLVPPRPSPPARPACLPSPPVSPPSRGEAREAATPDVLSPPNTLGLPLVELRRGLQSESEGELSVVLEQEEEEEREEQKSEIPPSTPPRQHQQQQTPTIPQARFFPQSCPPHMQHSAQRSRHNPSSSREGRSLSFRRPHRTSASISNVHTTDGTASGGLHHVGSKLSYWQGRLLVHPDGGPCVKMLYHVPRPLYDKYRSEQFELAASRGLLDPFKCRACQRNLRAILAQSTAPHRYHSYLLWCGRLEKCGAIDTKKCITCVCPKDGPDTKLHIGYLDLQMDRITVMCADCFDTCRDCRATENRLTEQSSKLSCIC